VYYVLYFLFSSLATIHHCLESHSLHLLSCLNACFLCFLNVIFFLCAFITLTKITYSLTYFTPQSTDFLQYCDVSHNSLIVLAMIKGPPPRNCPCWPVGFVTKPSRTMQDRKVDYQELTYSLSYCIVLLIILSDHHTQHCCSSSENLALQWTRSLYDSQCRLYRHRHVIRWDKCKKHSLSHQLTAQLHIENSKNKKAQALC